MNLSLLFSVIRRFKFVVLGGVVLGTALAIFSYGTPGFVGGKLHITPRGTETWESQAEIMISEQNFPYGRSVDEYTQPSKASGAPSVPEADEGYNTGLAPIYAAIVDGNTMQSQILSKAGVRGTVTATQVLDTSLNSGLPFVDIASTATTGTAAARLAATASSVLLQYVTNEQNSAGIPASKRVVLEPIQSGGAPQLVTGHSKKIPALIFIAVLAASITLAFMLENAHARVVAVPVPNRQDRPVRGNKSSTRNGEQVSTSWLPRRHGRSGVEHANGQTQSVPDAGTS